MWYHLGTFGIAQHFLPLLQYVVRMARTHTRSPPAAYTNTASRPVSPSQDNAPQNKTKETKKKTKKNQQTPQEKIDSIWQRFSRKRFNKALAVLPVLPSQTSASRRCSNELLQSGYDRAASECKQRVRKIITECKGRNMRYRDPDWDLVSSLEKALQSLRISDPQY